ncbi:MAG: 2-amino-4-hydroxy-6-hydroxymethyldihydropteridine diphosphokinase [Desulfotignum sp.]|nr:2-amino-4-hydroxy-6-hydroxymethyldihydropteridine diphosphokinase [Desulfotignum sp.]MCF8113276.1 2-amino-4-hydroxy-6-hydroxymethyldihydropteridine diphosphokinase [Desulfotignum sp.]MCF8125394.1 2-amino-4-hydroxy-6-hydroxymethyldihydropteridine diphosphokinase [Desulfotignum sp.]
MGSLSTAFLSIGSNKGDKTANLHLAIACLDTHEQIQVSAVSKFYKTQPQNFSDQDWFVNAAVKICCSTADPLALLTMLKQIESCMDKQGKPFRFGPRKIDLDIIYFDDRVLKTDEIEIPHPRMHERHFVLRPMCDIDPGAIHPVFSMTTEALFRKIEKQKDQVVIPLDEEETGEVFY